MHENDKKQNPQHTGTAGSGQSQQTRPAQQKNAGQNVTTNPREAGQGGGRTPLGEHGQDSRAWEDTREMGTDGNPDQADGQGDRAGARNQAASGSSRQDQQEKRSARADAGEADEQIDDSDDEFEDDDQDEEDMDDEESAAPTQTGKQGKR
jgi:hypothetical protein